jgi:hypothetical protein
MIQVIRQKVIVPLFLARLGVIVGLMAGLMGLGLLSPSLPLEFVLAAIGGLLIALVIVNRLEYSVLTIMFIAAFVRFSLPTGTQSRIVASLAMTIIAVLLWLVRMMVKDKRLQLKPSNTNTPLLAFMITAVISYAWSNVFRDPLVVVWKTWPIVQLGGLGVMILLPAAFLLTANNISQVRGFRLLFWLMVVVGVLYVVTELFHLHVPFINTGGLFSLWLVSLTYAQALFNKQFPFWLRLTLFGMMGGAIFISFVMRVSWLSGWVPSVVAIATISLMKSKKAFVILALLMAVYVGLRWSYFTGTVLPTENQESGITRMLAWEQNWQVTGKHLLFGTGPAGYAVYYMAYFPNRAMATHNNYIDILSQTGIVGIFFCVWFLGALGWTGYKLCRRLRGRADFSEGFINATVGGYAGTLVAMALGDWMFPFVYTQTIAGFDYAVYGWILLGGIVALANIYEKGNAE